jgi:hypothetical protein
MRKGSVVGSLVVLGLLALGATACSSSPSASAKKMAFCTANDSIDKASANVNSDAGFLALLKAHQADLNTMESNAPSGSVGQLARSLVSAADQAIRTNNVNPLTSINGGDVDTYCGVDGSGRPLPAYFAAGKGSAFCSVSDSINQGTNAASDAAGVLAFLAAHQNLITQYASYVPSLPGSIKSQAQTLVSTAQAAIAANNSALVGTQAIAQDSMDVQLYCGENS